MFEFIRNLQDGENIQPENHDRVIVLHQRDMVLSFTGDSGSFPKWHEVKKIFPATGDMPLLGLLDGERCFALEANGLPEYLPGNLQKFPIRQFLFEYPENSQSALCRARELLAWRKLHRYCGACREKLIASDHDSGLICPACHAVYYPQLAPAVIVAVTRNSGREILLAHNRNFAGNMYSLIAGFVEAGENVEMAIHREIWEETNLRVKNLRYITSQVWPFPNSLMLAFQAEYDSGTAEPDGEELSDLGWFTAGDHPELPSPGSVARSVIDQIFNRR